MLVQKKKITKVKTKKNYSVIEGKNEKKTKNKFEEKINKSKDKEKNKENISLSKKTDKSPLELKKKINIIPKITYRKRIFIRKGNLYSNKNNISINDIITQNNSFQSSRQSIFLSRNDDSSSLLKQKFIKSKEYISNSKNIQKTQGISNNESNLNFSNIRKNYLLPRTKLSLRSPIYYYKSPTNKKFSLGVNNNLKERIIILNSSKNNCENSSLSKINNDLITTSSTTLRLTNKEEMKKNISSNINRKIRQIRITLPKKDKCAQTNVNKCKKILLLMNIKKNLNEIDKKNKMKIKKEMCQTSNGDRIKYSTHKTNISDSQIKKIFTREKLSSENNKKVFKSKYTSFKYFNNLLINNLKKNIVIPNKNEFNRKINIGMCLKKHNVFNPKRSFNSVLNHKIDIKKKIPLMLSLDNIHTFQNKVKNRNSTLNMKEKIRSYRSNKEISIKSNEDISLAFNDIESRVHTLFEKLVNFCKESNTNNNE